MVRGPRRTFCEYLLEQHTELQELSSKTYRSGIVGCDGLTTVIQVKVLRKLYLLRQEMRVFCEIRW